MSNKKESLDQIATFSSDVQSNWLYTFRTVSGATIQDQVIAATEYLNSDHEQTSSPETESRCPCGSSQFHSRRWGMGSRLPKRGQGMGTWYCCETVLFHGMETEEGVQKRHADQLN